MEVSSAAGVPCGEDVVDGVVSRFGTVPFSSCMFLCIDFLGRLLIGSSSSSGSTITLEFRLLFFDPESQQVICENHLPFAISSLPSEECRSTSTRGGLPGSLSSLSELSGGGCLALVAKESFCWTATPLAPGKKELVITLA
jgi:hypothetical protein